MIKIFLIYLCAGLLIFANGLSGSFMLDDHAFFSDEIKDIRNVPRHFIPQAYKVKSDSVLPHIQPKFYYRPFAKFFPAISYFFFKQNMFLYHVFNLVFFIFAGWLIYVFLKSMSWITERTAFWVGLFYIIHPINGVFVNYITASVFSGQVCFMAGSLICLLMSMEGGKKREERGEMSVSSFVASFLFFLFHRPSSFLLHALSVLFFILALMCHDSAVMLPFYACFFLFFNNANLNSLKVFDVVKNVFQKTLGLWIVLFGYLIFRFYFASLQEGLLLKFARFEMNIFEYAASVGKLAVWYISKLFFPWDIVLIWASPVVRGVEVAAWLGVDVALLMLFLIAIFQYKKYPLFSLGAGIFLCGFFVLPFACLFQPAHGPMIEPHWFVFSSIGFFIILAKGVCWVIAHRNVENKSGVLFFKILCYVFIFFLFMSSWRHNYLWADEKRYALYWSEQASSIKAVWFHLGDILFKEEKFSQSIEYYEQSVRGTYQDYLSYQRMGLAAFQEGDYQKARFNFLVSLQLEPRQPAIQQRLEWIDHNHK